MDSEYLLFIESEDSVLIAQRPSYATARLKGQRVAFWVMNLWPNCTCKEPSYNLYKTLIKVLNTDRRWREWICLLICITIRPESLYIKTYLTEDNIANPCIKDSRCG